MSRASRSRSLSEVASAGLTDRERFWLTRKRRGLTQLEVAEAVGISQPWLSQWETGRRDLRDELVTALWDVVEAGRGAA